MKNVIIIGARGFAREIYNYILQCKEYNTEWQIKGFLDDKANALEGFDNYNAPILSSVEDYEVQPDDAFICALGDVKQKKKYASMILEKGGQFINVIHPLTNINPNNVKIGHGVIINPFTCITNDITIGDFVTIQISAVIGHDAKIGSWCQINSLTHIGGFCEIGNNVTIHPGAVILPKVKLGDGCVIGAGSVVIKNVKPGVTVFGSPAKKIF